MSEKLRLGILGGGGDSLIGVLHRVAANMFDQDKIIGGCFNPDPQENKKFGEQLGLNTNCNAVRSLTSPPSIVVSNAMIMPGNIDEKDMIKNISNGFYITELLGSSVSLITGDYSRGASGFWIKNGKLSNPISEATIAGNLKEMFLQMVPANNLDLNSSISAPSILINEMTIAGGSNT